MKTLKNKRFLITAAMIFCLLLFIVIILATKNKPYENPYPYGTTIDNFSSYFPNISQEKRDEIFYYLHDYIKRVPEEDTPTSGAIIRDDTATLENGFGFFIVDIESVEKSFQVSFILDDQSYDGSGVNFFCLPIKERIYDNDNCFIPIVHEDATNIWEHTYLLNYRFSNFSDQLYSIIDTFINSYNEASTANDIIYGDKYTVTISESSFKTSYINTDIICDFIITINDSREYSIIFRTDQERENYLAIYIHRTDSEGHDVGYILSNNKQYTNMLTEWLQSYNSNITPKVEKF